VTVIDLRAGGLALALQALKDMGFLDAVKEGEFNFLVFHILGPSIASLDEIEEIAPYVEDAHYFLVENHVNETTFFEWDPVTHRKYFEKVKTAGELTIPKLNEIAYEQVEIAGTPFSAIQSASISTARQARKLSTTALEKWQKLNSTRMPRAAPRDAPANWPR